MAETDNNPANGLKQKTAGTLKWNAIDKLCTQLLYAVTGIVLARVLSREDFGLVGAALVFQAFGLLLIDSGFSYALIQRKAPTRLDYSTVLWFNVAVAVAIYAILWPLAPWIASLFGGDERLIPIARVMFLTFIINASAIVQTNRLIKSMNVRMVAVANAIGLVAGSVVAIWQALTGGGAWAIVWQGLTLSAVKSAVLWLSSGWRPLWRFSWAALRSYTGVGMGVMFSAFLNTLFQNIYAFFIGNGVGLVALGYYTQADKWSKMGVTSVSQTLTQSFLPTLSAVQDDKARFLNACSKMNRMTAYVGLPAIGILAVMATPIFHTLFGVKWDAAIVLFQLLLAKGVLYIFANLFHHYILALGQSKRFVGMEALRDGAAAIALVFTLPFLGLSTPESPVLGVEILLWGQVAASAVACIGTMWVALRACQGAWWRWALDVLPYVGITAAVMGATWAISLLQWPAAATMIVQAIVAAAMYFGINAALGSKIQSEAVAYIRHRLR